jgi:formate hydrogenlyase subunit 3/multisubunit Na+/H+ antiporter MnhD subunit
MTTDDQRTKRLRFAGISTLTVFAWYALPDVVRSRGLRGLVKAKLLGVTALGVAMVPQVFPDAQLPPLEPPADLPEPAVVALGLGATALAVAGTVWGEKVVFAHGEHRRAQGSRWGHTPLALLLAAATGAVALLDWNKLAGPRAGN